MKTKKEQKAIQLLAQGKSQSEVADAIGVSQPTISRLKESKKEQIQHEIEKLIKSVPDITAQLIRDIQLSDKLSKALNGEISEEQLPALLVSDSKILTKFMELSYKKQVDVLKATGVYPSNTQSVFIQNIFQQGSNAVIAPSILNVLGEHLKEALKPEAIDAEVVS